MEMQITAGGKGDLQKVGLTEAPPTSLQLHLPGRAGQHGHLLEVPAVQPDRGVPQPAGAGPALHHHQPPLAGAAQPGQAARVQAGAPR